MQCVIKVLVVGVGIVLIFIVEEKFVADALTCLRDHRVDAVGRAGADDVAGGVVLVTDEADALPLGCHTVLAVGDGCAFGEGRTVVGSITVNIDMVALPLDDKLTVNWEIHRNRIFINGQGLAIGSLFAGLPSETFEAVRWPRLWLPGRRDVDAEVRLYIVQLFVIATGHVGGDGGSLLDSGVGFEVVQDVNDEADN